jgi:hypothetical protein
LNIASVTMKKTGLLIFHGVMERLFLLWMKELEW